MIPLFSSNRYRFTLIAIAFELGLLAVAIIVGWFFGISPLTRCSLNNDSMRELGLGLFAALPLLAGLYFIERWPCIDSLRELDTVVNEQLVPLFRPLSLVELAALSIAAGLGEEALFRGLIQDGVAGWIGGDRGPVIGIAVASVAFGVAHSITPAYVFLATVVGVYLGWLMIWSDSLMVPIVAHAAYDFCALVYLTRFKVISTI